MSLARLGLYTEYGALMFIQAAGMAAWLVPLGTVLDAHGLEAIKPLAFATSALACFVSPLFFGAMADRHASPVKVLRGLALATAVAMALATTAIQWSAHVWVILGLIQLYALCTAPTWGISSTIVFARLKDARQEFGPIRAMGTLGWMAGCLLISGLNADTSTLAGYSGSVIWLLVAGFTFFLPPVEPPPSVHVSWHERLGLDALTLLKNPQHRVMFITAALMNMAIAAFYPYAPAHLRELGFQHTTAWTSLGQVTEVAAMFTLGGLLLRWPLKWLVAAGLGFGVLRFVFSACNTRGWLLLGVTLHGASFVLVLIIAQIYLEKNVETAWRARAQALFALMTSGVGNLLGYLGSGWWFHICTPRSATNWPLFWGGLAATVGGVLIYFLVMYREEQAGMKPGPPAGADGGRNASWKIAQPAIIERFPE
jgi:nucleoside transporter